MCHENINRSSPEIVLNRAVKRPPYSRSEGLTDAQGPHVTCEKISIFTVSKIFVKIFVHNEIYGSVVNYCLSNAIHGTGQSIKSLKAYVCSNEYLSLSIATAVFVRSFLNLKHRSHI